MATPINQKIYKCNNGYIPFSPNGHLSAGSPYEGGPGIPEYTYGCSVCGKDKKLCPGHRTAVAPRIAEAPHRRGTASQKHRIAVANE